LNVLQEFKESNAQELLFFSELGNSLGNVHSVLLLCLYVSIIRSLAQTVNHCKKKPYIA
jgi:hypothetical protein